jgi:hypothetical protein
METRLATRTSHDEAFKTELANFPRKAIEGEFNIKILPIYSIAVTFDETSRPQIVLTRRETSELTDEELDFVAGGSSWPLGPDMDWLPKVQ